jgi:hypothetical protein
MTAHQCFAATTVTVQDKSSGREQAGVAFDSAFSGDAGAANHDDSHEAGNLVRIQSEPLPGQCEAFHALRRMISAPLSEPEGVMTNSRRLMVRKPAFARCLQPRRLPRSSYDVVDGGNEQGSVEHDAVATPFEQDTSVRRAYRLQISRCEAGGIPSAGAEDRKLLRSSMDFDGSVVEEACHQRHRPRAAYNAVIGSQIHFVMATNVLMCGCDGQV